MQHPVAVGADQCQIFEAGLLDALVLIERNLVVTLDVALAQIAVFDLKVEVAGLAVQRSVFLEVLVFLKQYQFGIPLLVFVELVKDSPLPEFEKFLFRFFLDFIELPPKLGIGDCLSDGIGNSCEFVPLVVEFIEHRLVELAK